MRVLIDYNSLAMRMLHLPKVGVRTEYPHWNLWHYLCFNAIYEFLLNPDIFDTSEITDVILAVDDASSNYWRKDIYPQYKGDRKDDPAINKALVNEHKREFLDQLSMHLPWRVLQVANCEADDIIGVVSQLAPSTVHSMDSDYLQLLSPTVRVFRPTRGLASLPGLVKIAGREMQVADVTEFLFLSIMTGQGGKDNVYNIKTPVDWDDTKKKPSYGPVAAQKLWQQGPEKATQWILDEVLEDRYELNRTLIDLKYIPEKLHEAILDSHVRVRGASPAFHRLASIYSWASFYDKGDQIQEVFELMHNNREPK